MNRLSFLDTKTIEQLKKELGQDKLHVRRNPDNGNLFFTCGNVVGAVGKNTIPKNPMVSKVKGDNGEFWLLHEQSSGGAEVIASF